MYTELTDAYDKLHQAKLDQAKLDGAFEKKLELIKSNISYGLEVKHYRKEEAATAILETFEKEGEIRFETDKGSANWFDYVKNARLLLTGVVRPGSASTITWVPCQAPDCVCSECNGAGKDEDGVECDHCHGMGKNKVKYLTMNRSLKERLNPRCKDHSTGDSRRLVATSRATPDLLLAGFAKLFLPIAILLLLIKIYIVPLLIIVPL